jgi:hypothetical protein
VNLNLTDFDESERRDYITVVALMAGADGKVTSEEILGLRELCKRFVLGPSARGQVLGASTSPPHDLEEILARLADTPLRFSLLLDLAWMAYRDGVLAPEEQTEYDFLAGKLNVSAAHAKAIMAFAESTFQPSYTPAKASENLDKLEQSGVPRAAVSLSAALQVLGLSGPVESHH